MKPKRILWIVLPVFAALLLLASPVMAADNCPVDECMPWPEALTKMATIAAKNMSLGMLKTVAAGAWLLDKIAIYLFDLIVNGSIWTSIQEGILSALASFMPGVLEDLIGGTDGLFYIALMIAGVSMTIPFVQTRLVNPGQAILWAAILVVLFVSGTAGYDLIGGIEGLRVNIMERIATAGDGSDITAIVTGPMMARSGDLSLEFDLLLKLPQSFEDEYFLEPQGYKTVRTVFIEIADRYPGSTDTEMETDDSLETRRAQAIPGVVLALLSLVGGYAALIFALVYAFLMTASLGLIIFLFAALPMGFFEFGRNVVAGIFNKYMQIVILSIGVSIFVGIISQALSFIPTSGRTVGAALEYVALLIPVLGIQTMFLKWSFAAMMSSKEVFGQTMNAAFQAGRDYRRPGMLRQAGASTLRTLGTAAAWAGGGGGIAVSLASHAAAGLLAPSAPHGAQPRGDVFSEMQKGEFQGGIQS